MATRKSKLRKEDLEELSDEDLLSLRLCDLPLSIEGSFVEPCISQIYQELSEKKIKFRPHFWISQEFFSPNGIPGVAVPFYLTHPRLTRLERKMMFEAEGETKEWCLKILRHEVGHAIEHAFRLARRKDRQRVFGKTSAPYPDRYLPKPFSRSYVIHLDMWYAQSHPDEDFAETFAVWLNPSSDWQVRFEKWPALKKLKFMDRLMAELQERKPPVVSQIKIEPLSQLKMTLKEHYFEKKSRQGDSHPDFFEKDLRRLFADSEAFPNAPSAAKFLKSIRKEVRRQVSYWTNEHQYTIDQVIERMIKKSLELDLRLKSDPEKSRNEFLVLLTVQTMNYLHSGKHKVVL